jgi:arylsulfatase A-like enzyme
MSAHSSVVKFWKSADDARGREMAQRYLRRPAEERCDTQANPLECKNLISDPRAPASQHGQRSDAMTLNIDLAPTILELAGRPVPATMQGRSFLSLARDPRQPWRQEFFYEHLYAHGPQPPRHIQPSEGVRTRDWKYLVWLEQSGPAREELYDLRADPLEMKNLVAAPAAAAQLETMRRQYQTMRENLK